MATLLLRECCTADERKLCNFDDSDAKRQWQIVNDGVMGGRSQSRFIINEDSQLVFSGVLSLANNGGFASVRSRGKPLNLRDEDTISVRVKGDGRKYTLNLYPATRRTAFSYRVDFQTKKDEWITVEAPLSSFRATSFGRPVGTPPVRASQVNSIGILLGDKQPGAFRIVVDSITADNTK